MEQMQASYRANAVVRAQQVARLRQMVDTLRMPLIVCGDFNDMPSSYTYRAMKGDLHDGFKVAGAATAVRSAISKGCCGSITCSITMLFRESAIIRWTCLTATTSLS